jgi:thioredoxin-related protein
LSFFRYLPLVFLLWAGESTNAAEPIGIPLAADLSAIADLAAQQKVPVVVFVSRDGCPYCRTLRKSVLAPMYSAGKFEQRAILVEVNIDSTAPLTGFDGKPVSAQDFAGQYKAIITPTLLFLDDQGRQLSKPRVGISNLDLYVFYLDRAIGESLAKLGGSG